MSWHVIKCPDCDGKGGIKDYSDRLQTTNALPRFVSCSTCYGRCFVKIDINELNEWTSDTVQQAAPGAPDWPNSYTGGS